MVKPGKGAELKWPGIDGIPVSQREPGVGPLGQRIESGMGTPVGNPMSLASGPVTVIVPLVTKKPGTLGGRKRLPVLLIQPLASMLMCEGMTGLPVK